MTKKRSVKRGIGSLEKQIEAHELKIEEEQSKPNPRPWLIDYWLEEINLMREEISRKDDQLKRKHGK